MLQPEHGDDHDYAGRRHLSRGNVEVLSVEINQPPVTRSRRRNQRSAQPVRVGNTDHDYLATGADLASSADHGDAFIDEGQPIEAEHDPQAQGNEGVLGLPPDSIEAVDAAVLTNGSAAQEFPQEPDNNVENSGTVESIERAAGPTTAPNADTDSVVNLTSPSPPKKRKRLSLLKKVSNTPNMASTGSDADVDEDDGLTCPICLDVWEMSGEHRLASLNCGHLFGDSCIRRWLKESARQSGKSTCPQCKSKARSDDIRFLYAKRLRAIDRSEEHRMREQLSDEVRRTQTLELELATLRMSYAQVTQKIKTLESENERMKLLLRHGGGYSCATPRDEGDSKLLQRLRLYKLYMERNIEITREPGCRVMIYAEQQSTVIVSQKSSQGLFPGYGLRFIDTPTFKASTFLHASGKLLRDISLSADQQLLAVTSMESRSKLFDLRTRQVTAMFTPAEKPLWSCAMDRNEREYFLYLGAQHGSTYVYDVRFPETVVSEFQTENDLSPVINVAPVPTSKLFPCGGFLVCKLTSLWFYEYSSGTATPTRLNVEGPFISMNFDGAQESLLVSTRSSARFPQSRYILGRMDKIGDIPVFDVKVTFFGSKTTPVMIRSSQIAVESNTLIAAYIQDSKLLTLFDVCREQRLQSLPVQEIVYDTCPIYTKELSYLAALTETKCRIYKLTAT